MYVTYKILKFLLKFLRFECTVSCINTWISSGPTIMKIDIYFSRCLSGKFRQVLAIVTFPSLISAWIFIMVWATCADVENVQGGRGRGSRVWLYYYKSCYAFFFCNVAALYSAWISKVNISLLKKKSWNNYCNCSLLI